VLMKALKKGCARQKGGGQSSW